MRKSRLGVQLWSVHQDCAKDLEGTLAAIAKMGYEGVELAGTHNRPGAEWVRMLKQNGLVAKSAHVGIDQMTPDRLQETMDTYGAFDCKCLIVPGLGGDYVKSADGFKWAAEIINKAAETGKKAGFRFGYHNHAFEFDAVDGVLPMDVLAQNLKPEQVLQFDMGWVFHAGRDGVEWLKKYPGRSAFVHVKAHSATNPKAILGADDVDWPTVLKACVDTGKAEWLIVEHENHKNAPMVSIEQCLVYLKTVAP